MNRILLLCRSRLERGEKDEISNVFEMTKQYVCLFVFVSDDIFFNLHTMVDIVLLFFP